MHYHSGVAHVHEFDDPEHEHEMASEYERIHGLRFVEGQETFDLNSVGIDIGSSTSHLMFSRLTLMRIGGALSSRFEIVKREVTYASPILLTPYVDASTIDVQALGRFIAESYAAAGVERDGVDAGAVIATGEAAKKENAEAIVALFAATYPERTAALSLFRPVVRGAWARDYPWGQQEGVASFPGKDYAGPEHMKAWVAASTPSRIGDRDFAESMASYMRIAASSCSRIIRPPRIS